MPTASAFFEMPPEEVTAHDEARFFGRLKGGNNTFKRTAAGRLAPIDTSVIAQIQASGDRLREMLDLGISSGTTTLELASALRAAGQRVAVMGTDRSLNAYLVDLPIGCRALVEPDGHVLQYDLWGLAIRPWRRRLDYFSGMAIVGGTIDRLCRGAVMRRLRGGTGMRSVALISPRLKAFPAFAMVEDDVTVANSGFGDRFDLVRAANILNRHYFDPNALERAIANVKGYLRGPGAWLLIVRTHGDSDHRGTLFRMNRDRTLDVVERYGTGSEIEAQVLRDPC